MSQRRTQNKTLVAKRVARELHSVPLINQLPCEILAEVFWNCVSETTWMSCASAPLLLCRVCSSWRALALATPKIWTTIRINICNSTMNPSVAAHVTDAWLKRSQSLPLTLLHLQVPSSYSPASWTRIKTALVKASLSVLYAHSSRWQDVTLDLHTFQLSSFPRLDTLCLRSFHLKGSHHKFMKLPFESSLLTKLSWPFPLDPSTNPQIPWSQISHLHILTGMTYFSATEIIRLCPQLEEFSAMFVHYAPTNNRLPRQPLVENFHLRRLKIVVYDVCRPFFESLTLPALEEFDYTFGGGDVRRFTRHSVQPELPRLLTRLKCKLKKLRLSRFMLISFHVLECLAHESLETIQTLYIEDYPTFTDDLLIRLISPSPTGQRILLPNLTHLTLVRCVKALSSGLLGKVVASRCCSPESEVERLQVLSLTVPGLYEVDENLIKDAIANGLVANIMLLG
ncbi:hypothetical protein F5887DRAFT_989397, partial [Amanita rubescens]